MSGDANQWHPLSETEHRFFQYSSSFAYYLAFFRRVEEVAKPTLTEKVIISKHETHDSYIIQVLHSFKGPCAA